MCTQHCGEGTAVREGWLARAPLRVRSVSCAWRALTREPHLYFCFCALSGSRPRSRRSCLGRRRRLLASLSHQAKPRPPPASPGSHRGPTFSIRVAIGRCLAFAALARLAVESERANHESADLSSRPLVVNPESTRTTRGEPVNSIGRLSAWRTASPCRLSVPSRRMAPSRGPCLNAVFPICGTSPRMRPGTCPAARAALAGDTASCEH